VIDGVDGRAHHVRFRGIEALPARIVEVRRFGGSDGPRSALVLANRSDIDLDREVTAPGATRLDCRLVERERMLVAMSGFGQEVRNAMEAPAEHLAADGLSPSPGAGQRPVARPPRHAAAGNSMPPVPGCPTRSGCSTRRQQPASWLPALQ
jgi:Protein of unknown function (DUF3363)